MLTPLGKKTRTNNTWKQTIHIKPNEIIKKEKPAFPWPNLENQEFQLLSSL